MGIFFTEKESESILCFCIFKYFFIGSFSYAMITDAWNVKAEAEEEMKLQWLSEHGHVRNVWGNKERVTKNNRGKKNGDFPTGGLGALHA